MLHSDDSEDHVFQLFIAVFIYLFQTTSKLALGKYFFAHDSVTWASAGQFFSLSHLRSLPWLVVIRRRWDSGWKAEMALLTYLALHLDGYNMCGLSGHLFLSLQQDSWASSCDNTRWQRVNIEASRFLRVRPRLSVASLLQ